MTQTAKPTWPWLRMASAGELRIPNPKLVLTPNLKLISSNRSATETGFSQQDSAAYKGSLSSGFVGDFMEVTA